MKKRCGGKNMNRWYEQSFGEDYLKVYQHRSVEEAVEEVAELLSWFPLKAGVKVLDLCCGTGRHSFAFQQLGFDVTGIDLSAVLLREAEARNVKGEISFVQGDMRNLPWGNHSFDAVCNLFTSFGYFESEEEDQKVLNEIERVLRPDGYFVIDFLNPMYIINNLIPHSTKEIGGEVVREERWIENHTVNKKITIQDRTYFEKVRLYTKEQLTDKLQTTGLEVLGVQGDYAGNPYDAEQSKRMMLWGKKPRE
jgi:ubiquinone/menaquinone biosynthesis C-methylase UbiE